MRNKNILTYKEFINNAIHEDNVYQTGRFDAPSRPSSERSVAHIIVDLNDAKNITNVLSSIMYNVKTVDMGPFGDHTYLLQGVSCHQTKEEELEVIMAPEDSAELMLALLRGADKADEELRRAILQALILDSDADEDIIDEAEEMLQDYIDLV